MADNFLIPTNIIGTSIAAKEISGVKYPKVILTDDTGTLSSAKQVFTLLNAVTANFIFLYPFTLLP